MMKEVVLFFILLLISISLISCSPSITSPYKKHPVSATPQNAPQSFDCKAKIFAWEYAQTIQPWRDLKGVYDALQLRTLCNYDFNESARLVSGAKPPHFELPPTSTEIYVDALKGNDNNQGSLASPYQTVARSVLASRGKGGANIFLRAGKYYLSNTIQLGPQDSNLVFSSYNGESVQINGGQLLKTLWKPYAVTPPKPVVFANTNNVGSRAVSRGDTATVKYLGDFTVLDDCINACLQFNKSGLLCHSLTWHSPLLGGEWAKQCFACTDYFWQPVAENNHASAQITSKNIYVADITGQNVHITGLQVNGVRAVRARYPNANPETDLFPVGYISSAASWTPPHTFPKAVTNTLSSPVRTTGVAFQQYTVGVGGPCSVFDPPESYWCSANCAGGGSSTYIVPSGLSFTNTTFVNAWTNPVGAIVHAFHPGHWENWIFEVDFYNANTRTLGWTVGGFQGARGSATGGEWYIENIFEELDNPNEFFYDAKNQKLYYFNNGTGAPSASIVFESTLLKILFNVTGTQRTPVTGIAFHGITFQNTAYTYLDLHGVPSGGDWALQRSAALFFEGTEGLVVDNCTFTRLDGNALFLSGFNRNATIQNNEFVWIGDNAMAAWGYTVNIDGTDGRFPKYTKLLNNYIHEIGHYQKQTSAWFQAKTAQTFLQGNILFNGPRAGINFNDGFGGGNELTNNLLFNMVRETYDHGPFNSWDRQPFLTTIANGTASLNAAYTLIHHNMFVCNYHSEACIDNDDGSTFYKNYNNFEVYGCHKDYYAGHNKYTYDTVLAYPNCWGRGCAWFTEFVSGYVDGVYNVSCVLPDNKPYLIIDNVDSNHLDKTKLPVTSNNKVYSPLSSLTVKVGSATLSEQAWQALGQDAGTKLMPFPTDDEIISMGKAVLKN